MLIHCIATIMYHDNTTTYYIHRFKVTSKTHLIITVNSGIDAWSTHIHDESCSRHWCTAPLLLRVISSALYTNYRFNERRLAHIGAQLFFFFVFLKRRRAEPRLTFFRPPFRLKEIEAFMWRKGPKTQLGGKKDKQFAQLFSRPQENNS